jgi:hypothetical protein
MSQPKGHPIPSTLRSPGYWDSDLTVGPNTRVPKLNPFSRTLQDDGRAVAIQTTKRAHPSRTCAGTRACANTRVQTGTRARERTARSRTARHSIARVLTHSALHAP